MSAIITETLASPSNALPNGGMYSNSHESAAHAAGGAGKTPPPGRTGKVGGVQPAADSASGGVAPPPTGVTETVGMRLKPEVASKEVTMIFTETPPRVKNGLTLTVKVGSLVSIRN